MFGVKSRPNSLSIAAVPLFFLRRCLGSGSERSRGEARTGERERESKYKLVFR